MHECCSPAWTIKLCDVTLITIKEEVRVHCHLGWDQVWFPYPVSFSTIHGTHCLSLLYLANRSGPISIQWNPPMTALNKAACYMWHCSGYETIKHRQGSLAEFITLIKLLHMCVCVCLQTFHVSCQVFADYQLKVTTFEPTITKKDFCMPKVSAQKMKRWYKSLSCLLLFTGCKCASCSCLLLP